jgi:hypothetical protein
MADVIYTTTNCPGCHLLHSQLAARPIPEVRVFNLDERPDVRPFFDATGVRAVPVAVIDGRAIPGVTAILAALRAKYGRP